jgi:protein tyrosine phosphatase (PTP) superfamily phosphohydrolase (DUF442 family)
MKLSFLSMITLLIIFNMTAHCQTNSDKAVVIEEYQNLFKYQNFYLSGQPTLEALKWLRSEGVTKVINLRTEDENESYSEESYDEASVAKSLGYDYLNIAVYSSVDYTPEKLQEISAQLNADEKILIHCRSAGRVTNFFMAYLVQSRSYSIDEAVEVGKGLKYSFPLEDILGVTINMEIENE